MGSKSSKSKAKTTSSLRKQLPLYVKKNGLFLRPSFFND